MGSYLGGQRPYDWSVRTAFALVLVAVVAACGPSLDPTGAITPSPTAATLASAPRIAPPPVNPPTPPGTNLPQFACADAAGGKTGVANTIAARMSEQDGYDRFVLQLASIVPTYTVKRQSKPIFTSAPSGQAIMLAGSAGVLVTVHSAQGTTTFTGSTDIVQTTNQVLIEARQVQDFEGYVSWGLGLSKPACMRVFTLSDPARLVVDLALTPS